MQTKLVDTSIICAWLGVPPDQWPPDHYTLLGLKPATADLAVIEQQVQKRLELVRRYQLTNPEASTEAMNRLAQAYVCLSDPQAKRAYDRALFGGPSEEPPPPPASGTVLKTVLPPTVGGNDGKSAAPAAPPSREAPRREPAPSLRTVLEPAPVGSSVPAIAPAPVPILPDAGEVELLVLAEEEIRAVKARQAAGAPPLPPPPPMPQVTPELALAPRPENLDDTARTSPEARRGLGTKRGLYQRVVRTRALRQAWEAAGRYLEDPKRKLARPAEAREIVELLNAIRRLLEGFPPLLGEAGQTGYLVVALARQSVIVPTFQTLLPTQREALARDWLGGQRLLEAHYQYLRDELRGLRRKTAVGRSLRAAHAYIVEHPGTVLLALGSLALAIAAVRQFIL